MLDNIVELCEIQLNSPKVRGLVLQMCRFSGTELIIEQDREAALMQVSVWETVQVRRAGSSVEYDERCGLA